MSKDKQADQADDLKALVASAVDLLEAGPLEHRHVARVLQRLAARNAELEKELAASVAKVANQDLRPQARQRRGQPLGPQGAAVVKTCDHVREPCGYCSACGEVTVGPLVRVPFMNADGSFTTVLAPARSFGSAAGAVPTTMDCELEAMRKADKERQP